MRKIRTETLQYVVCRRKYIFTKLSSHNLSKNIE